MIFRIYGKMIRKKKINRRHLSLLPPLAHYKFIKMRNKQKIAGYLPLNQLHLITFCIQQTNIVIQVQLQLNTRSDATIIFYHTILNRKLLYFYNTGYQFLSFYQLLKKIKQFAAIKTKCEIKSKRNLYYAIFPFSVL